MCWPTVEDLVEFKYNDGADNAHGSKNEKNSAHNSKLFSNLNFPPNQKIQTSPSGSHPPDQQRSGIWENLAKISHQFLRMEGEDVIPF